MGADWGSRLRASAAPPEGLGLSRAKCRSDSKCQSLGRLCGFRVCGLKVYAIGLPNS